MGAFSPATVGYAFVTIFAMNAGLSAGNSFKATVTSAGPSPKRAVRAFVSASFVM